MPGLNGSSIERPGRAAILGRETLTRAHHVALVTFAALVALFEGPATIACVAVLLTTALLALDARRATALGASRTPSGTSSSGASASGAPPSGWARRLARLRSEAVLVAIAIWALAGVPGLVLASPRPPSQDATRPLFALAFFVGAYAIPAAEARVLRWMAIAFGAAIVANGAYGYLQLAFGELPLDRLLLKNPHSPQIYVPEHQLDPTQAGATGLRGLSGLFYNRLKLAHVGIVGMLLLALAAARPDARRATRALAVAGFAILAGAVVLAYARMALVAFAAAIAIGGVFVLRARTALVALAGLGGLVALVAHMSPHVEARLARVTTDLGHRGQIWQAALDIARDHPILGAGHGVYRVLAPRYYPEGTSRAWQIDAHDLWLHVLAETGAVGLAAFTLAVGLAVGALVVRVRRARGTWDDRAFLDRFALVGLLAVLALGVTHFPLHHAPVALVFWVLLGVADGGAWRSRNGAR